MTDPTPEYPNPRHIEPNHGRPPGRRLPPSLLLIMAILLFLAGIGVDRFWLSGGPGATASSSLTSQKDFQTLEDTWNIIQKDYVDASSINNAQLIYGAASGMVDALGDTGHSRFLDPVEAKEFEGETSGSYVGIGVEIDTTGSLPVIVSPFDDSPADKAGIRSGDVILEVNGQDVTGMPFEQLSVILRGPAGTKVTIQLRHKNQTNPYIVTLTRAVITIKPVSWVMLPDHIADIRLSQFSSGATDEMKAALRAAHAQGAKGIILDLRDDPGGLVSEAIGVASLFMPEGTTIYQSESRNSKPQSVKTFGKPFEPTLPMAVLVNNGSASAAEIVGAALRDNHRAVLIGDKTFGTGTVLSTYPLPDGSAVLIGTSLWLTANGQQIWKKGVEPDLVVPLSPSASPSKPKDEQKATVASLRSGQDTQLFAAYARLTGMPGPPATPGATPSP